VDGLVLARSWFHHSLNYRAVVAHGSAHLVDDPDERHRALAALMEKLLPGRSATSRAPNSRELAQTALLALPLREVSVRARASGVADDPDDLDLPYWAGVVPLRRVAGTPEPDAGVTVPAPTALGAGM